MIRVTFINESKQELGHAELPYEVLAEATILVWRDQFYVFCSLPAMGFGKATFQRVQPPLCVDGDVL